MTDQTIDGVPRELLRRMAGLVPDYTCAQLDEDEAQLRALLDAPASKSDGVNWKVVADEQMVIIQKLKALVVAEQPALDDPLKAFARSMIDAALEGGSVDGGDIQDIAVKHGLLRIEQRKEECGVVCACRSEGDGFPAACCRKTALLCGKQP